MSFPRAGLFVRGSSTAFDPVVEWLGYLFAELVKIAGCPTDGPPMPTLGARRFGIPVKGGHARGERPRRSSSGKPRRVVGCALVAAPSASSGPVLERSWLTWLAPLMLVACHGKAVDSDLEQRETGPVDSDEPDSPADDCYEYPQGELDWNVKAISDVIEVRSPDLGVTYVLEDSTTGGSVGMIYVDPGQWQLVVSTADGACNASAVESLSTCGTVTFPTVEEC